MARELFQATAAGRTILTPNNELAAALMDAVERMHLEAGHAVWPTPRIRDVGAWLRERHAQRQLSDASLPRVLSDIEERELWRSVILDSDAGTAFIEPEGAVTAAQRARRALSEYGIPLQALAEYRTDESLALFEWSRRFAERCREFHSIASHQLLSEATADAAPLSYIESPAWRPAARRWIRAQGAAPLAPQTHPAAVAQRFNADSPPAELAAAADWARRQLQASPNFRAWICIPDLNARRAVASDAFDAALAPRRFSLSVRETAAPYALAGGTPLSDYAPVRAALNALAASAGAVSCADFGALLRMPDWQPSVADAGAAALLERTLRSCGPHEADLEAWLGLAERLGTGPAGAVAVVRRLRLFKRTLGAVRGVQPLSRWVSVWVDAFESGPWAERQRWSSSEFQSAERLRELLAALATADELFGRLSAESAARVLRRAARDTAFQPETGIPPIWVSGQLMDPWLTYDGVWIAGCAEERWPPPVDPIPLIPVRLQREYGVVQASAAAQLQLAEDLQQRWQSRAPSVFSCADPGDGRRVTFSPLLLSLPPVPLESPPPQPHWHALARRAPVLESLMDEQAPPFASAERTRGVATLRAQARCAFRGFAETRLTAEPLERPVPGFNVRERGDMVHQALERIWRELRTWEELTRLAPERRARLVSDAAEHAVARQCLRRDPGVRWRRREVPRLERLLHAWLETECVREPFEVEWLEPEGQTARHGGLEFKVRIDRVDRLADGGRVLIDYKTGMAAPDWRGDRPDNPQLPIYAQLRPERLVAVAYGRVNASECYFSAEAERGGIFKPRGQPSKLEGMPNFADLVDLWSRRIEKIASEFAAGNAEVAPTLRACASCRLQALCRIPGALDEGANLGEHAAE